MIIRINIDHEENVTVIEERKAMNVFSQRELHMRETCVDVQNDSRVIILVI